MHEPEAGEERALPETNNTVSSIAQQTKEDGRQLIVFCNTKRGAESQAEKLAKKQTGTENHAALATKALAALSTPTKQCRRLATCLQRGVAFHHAGLPAAQRDLIEEAFKQKQLLAICATPTLAAGVDLPAFRVVIRDHKRYGGPWGMTSIPVLEYEQMAGRAGRPGKDPWGEALLIAKDDREAEELTERYIEGEPEEIYSKLAVEPVLRTYVLSLVASEFVKTTDDLHAFFATTFYAHQYGDMGKLTSILERMTDQLTEWEFLKPTGEEATEKDGFVNASTLGTKKEGRPLQATPLGRRVSELYLDPYTAWHLIKGFRRCTSKLMEHFTLIHLLASCLELRPYVKAKAVEYELIEEKIAVHEHQLLHLPPTRYSDEYDDYLHTIKTAMLFEDWTEEQDEETLMERYGVRPGELHAKLAIMDWLAYSGGEIARLMSYHEQRGLLLKLRTRLKHGAKEELLPLLKLREIGRVRARTLFRNGIKNVSDVQRVETTTIAQLIGKAVAIKLKEQVGIKVRPEDVQVKPKKRKGQIALTDY